MKNFSKTSWALATITFGAFVSEAAVIGQLGILDDSTGLGPGDQYRLVFVTSGTTTGASTDISTYNTFVQGLANSAGLGGGSWNVIGSTSAVSALENTGTDGTLPDVPIFLTDGTTLIAANNASLWDGAIDNFIDLDENGNSRLDD